MNKSTILYKTLARALSMMRPHNSEGTRRLTDWREAFDEPWTSERLDGIQRSQWGGVTSRREPAQWSASHQTSAVTSC
jgi:hypothetical protein